MSSSISLLGRARLRRVGTLAIGLGTAVVAACFSTSVVDTEREFERIKPGATAPALTVDLLPPSGGGSGPAPPIAHVWDANWDLRAPSAVPATPTPVAASPHPAEPAQVSSTVNETAAKTSRRPTATRNIIMIRHGQYQDKEEDANKRILTNIGRQQVAHTGDRLSKLFPNISNVYSSDMPRAIESATIICERLRQNLGHPYVAPVDTMLREGSPVAPSPHSSAALHSADVYFRDGARIEAAFRQYFYRASASQEKDSFDVLVCHGNVIRYCVMRALQLPPTAWLRMSLPHGSITWFVIRPNGNVSLRFLGNDGFIPPELTSS